MKYVVCNVWLLLATLFIPVVACFRTLFFLLESFLIGILRLLPHRYHEHLTRGLTSALEFPGEWQTSCLTHLSLCRSTNGPSVTGRQWCQILLPAPLGPEGLAVRTGRWITPGLWPHVTLRTRLTVHVVRVFLDPSTCWKFKMRASKPAVQFRRSAVSNSLRPHGLQHT